MSSYGQTLQNYKIVIVKNWNFEVFIMNHCINVLWYNTYLHFQNYQLLPQALWGNEPIIKTFANKGPTPQGQFLVVWVGFSK